MLDDREHLDYTKAWLLFETVERSEVRENAVPACLE